MIPPRQQPGLDARRDLSGRRRPRGLSRGRAHCIQASALQPDQLYHTTDSRRLQAAERNTVPVPAGTRSTTALCYNQHESHSGFTTHASRSVIDEKLVLIRRSGEATEWTSTRATCCSANRPLSNCSGGDEEVSVTYTVSHEDDGVAIVSDPSAAENTPDSPDAGMSSPSNIFTST